MVMFVLNKNDYSKNVVADKYVMNNQPISKEYTDITGRVHMYPVRNKVVGSFDMLFETFEEYLTFLENYNAAGGVSKKCAVCVNFPSNEVKAIECKMTITPTRTRDGQWNDIIKQFSVKIEEL